MIVECPGCKNRYVYHKTLFMNNGLSFFSRHLIADHLGWFKDSTQDGTLRTIEDMLKAKGEKVRRGRLDVGGTMEYIE